MAELNNKSQRLSRRATKSKTQATKSRIYASSLCKFSSGLTRLYSVSLLWIERSSVMTVLAHKRRARPAHLKKGIYDSHHHAKRYRDREPARAIAMSGTISRALAERIFLDLKVSVAQK